MSVSCYPKVSIQLRASFDTHCQGVLLQDSEKIKLRGIKVISPENHNHNSAIFVEKSNIVILDDVAVNNAAHSGLYVIDSSDISVWNSSIDSSAYSGIYLQAVDRVTIQGNEITGNYTGIWAGTALFGKGADNPKVNVKELSFDGSQTDIQTDIHNALIEDDSESIVHNQPKHYYWEHPKEMKLARRELLPRTVTMHGGDNVQRQT